MGEKEANQIVKRIVKEHGLYLGQPFEGTPLMEAIDKGRKEYLARCPLAGGQQHYNLAAINLILNPRTKYDKEHSSSVCDHNTVLEIYTDETHTKVAHYRCVGCGEKRKEAFGEHIVHDREKKSGEMSSEELIKIAADAYGDAHVPLTYEEAREHKSGDGLADFIVIELVEGTEGEKDKLERAIQLMDHAEGDIQKVKFALMAAQAKRE